MIRAIRLFFRRLGCRHHGHEWLRPVEDIHTGITPEWVAFDPSDVAILDRLTREDSVLIRRCLWCERREQFFPYVYSPSGRFLWLEWSACP